MRIERKIKLSVDAKKQPRKSRKRKGVKNQKECSIPDGMVSITEFEDRIYEKQKPIKC